MKYHAKLEYGNGNHYWWNKSKDNFISDLIIPFVNGQVISVTKGNGKRLLNMKNVTLLTAFKTKSLLKATDEKTYTIK